MRVVRRELFFHKPAKTSRDVMRSHDVRYIVLSDKSNTIFGIGECSPIWGLSPEVKENFAISLQEMESPFLQFSNFQSILNENPSIRFAIETACLDYKNGGKRQIFEDSTTGEIYINGLVWMNDIKSMFAEARSKIERGFDTIKFKVGALDFQQEIELLNRIRSEVSSHITIRLDANGAFTPLEALRKLDALSKFNIHSIEQPIKSGQLDALAHLVSVSPIQIALDEELISASDLAYKKQLLDKVNPHYIVLKPTLHGGLSGCDQWISLAEERNIGWWITSALESNIGLNAIAQWTAIKNPTLPQGLGTGELYSNNIPSPLQISSGQLWWSPEMKWDVSEIITGQ